MPPVTPSWLSVVTFEPRLGSASVDVRPRISIRFNTPIDPAQVNTDPGVNEFLIVVRMDTDEPVVLEYVDYDATARTLTVQPSGSLAPGAMYQVTVRKELKNAQGRSMASDRIWNFQVDADPLGEIVLRAPGDSTAYTTVPTLEWQGAEVASGTVTYDIQVDTEWRFGDTVVWETSLSVAASGASGTQRVAIGASLSDSTTYYWRVRARTETVTGDWTEPWAFWVGQASHTSPETQLTWEEADHFRLLSIEPPDGSFNVSEWPTLQVRFSQAVDPVSVSGNIQLWKEAIDGQISVSGAALVSGTLVVTDTLVTFEPAEDLIRNSRYTLLVRKGVASVGGDTLAADVDQYFSSTYTPLYGGVIAVRGLHGACCDDVSTDEVFYQLWRASLEVHRFLLSRQLSQDPRSLTFADLINYVPTKITYGMVRYTELAAAISILEGHYFDLLKRAGTRTALGVFEYQTDLAILPELRAKIKEMKGECDAIGGDLLNQSVQPRWVQKSMLWRQELGVLDLSYEQRPALRRDCDPFRRRF